MFQSTISYVGKHILLVEDQIVTAMVEANAIKKAGFELSHVINGEEAIEFILSGKHVDLVLMDIDMGEGISGIEAAEQILLIIDIPILFLSGHTEADVIAKTECVTSYGYVLKDGNVFVILAAIRMAIRLHATRVLYKETFDNSFNGIVIHRLVLPIDQQKPEFIFYEVNNAYEKLSGLKRCDVRNKTISAVFGDTTDVQEINREYKQILDNHASISKRLYFKPLDKWFDLNIVPLTHEYLSVMMHDVTSEITTQLNIRHKLEKEVEVQDHLILALCKMVEQRDPYTSGHQERVSRIAEAIGKRMCLPLETCELLLKASMVHDIGKNSIPSEYLVKPSKLTPIEFSLIKEHSRYGYSILESIPFGSSIAEIVYQHHERFNGSGYPRQLKGSEILLEARIIAVADVVESMASHRPYREKLGLPAAIKELTDNQDVLYDKNVVDTIVSMFEDGTLGELL